MIREGEGEEECGVDQTTISAVLFPSAAPLGQCPPQGTHLNNIRSWSAYILSTQLHPRLLDDIAQSWHSVLQLHRVYNIAATQRQYHALSRVQP